MKVSESTGLRGRWDVLGYSPKIICDTAHNLEGLRLVFKQLKDEKFHQLHLVIGIVDDKDLNSLLGLFPTDAQYYFCKPNIHRGLDAHRLAESFNEKGLNGSIHSSVNSALNSAKEIADKEDLIYVGGSTFVVAEII